MVFLHGTSRANKEWPEPLWVELGQRIAQQGMTVLLPGGSTLERERAQRLAGQIPRAQALPSLDLTTLSGVLAHAHGVVGVDTGLSHLATALQRPVVALYTATRPEATGVYGSFRAVNLGGIGQCPTVEAVVTELERLDAWKAE